MEHRFQVQGMTCGHCEKAVDQAVHRVDPVAKVAIQRDTGAVQVWSDQPRRALAEAITEEGYQVAG